MAITLIDLLPDINIRDDSSGDLSRFVNDVLQPVLDIQIAEQQRWVDQGDPDIATARTIEAMLESLGNPFNEIFDQPLDTQRLLVRVLVQLYRTIGVEASLFSAVRILTGADINSVITPATYNKGFKLGVNILADTSGVPVVTDPTTTDFGALFPGPSFLRYSFQISINSVLTQAQRDLLTGVIKKIKPAHTHFLGFVEPSTPPVINHWALGFSKLGVNTALHA